jgi:hypothetical protein
LFDSFGYEEQRGAVVIVLSEAGRTDDAGQGEEETRVDQEVNIIVLIRQ